MSCLRALALMRLLVAVPAAAGLLLACGAEPETVPDRRTAPEAALASARAALHRHDLAGYFDSITDAAVRRTLVNSIGICLLPKDPEVRRKMEALGNSPSIGCEAILQKYGWVAGDYTLTKIARPREFATELEGNHRLSETGSSFVWDYLDDMELENVRIDGNTASAVADWHGEKVTVRFERDSSGWRFDPNPEQSAGDL